MNSLQLSPQVKEYLGKIGEPVTYNRNSPYPAWQIADIQSFSFNVLKSFLSRFDLTTYYRYYAKPKENILQPCIEIAPSVPASVRDSLSQLLASDYKESIESPCVYWTIQESQEDEYEVLLDRKLHKVRSLLRDYKMVCYKYRDFANPPYYPQYNSIAVVNSSNKFDIVFFEELYGSTYGIYEEDVINTLMLLDKKFGVEFIALDQIQLQKTPTGDDFLELYQIISKLCPDVYYDGAAGGKDVEEFLEPILVNGNTTKVKIDGNIYELNITADVIMYYSPIVKKDLVHRAVLRIHAKDGVFYLTKGDNTETNFMLDEDCEFVYGLYLVKNACLYKTAIPESEIQGKMLFKIPYIGYIKVIPYKIFLWVRGLL